MAAEPMGLHLMLNLQDRFPVELRVHRFRNALGAHGVLPKRVGDATSQLDLRFLTPLSVAGCGRLQLGVPHYATSVDYCK